MPAVRKTTTETKHPARPQKGTPDIKAMCADIAKRYPKILGELAK